MAGENSLFGASGFNGTPAIPGGAASFRVMSMSYGIEQYYVEKETRAQRTIYLKHLVDDNFSVNLGFNGWQQYNDAATWFQAYGSFVSDPSNASVHPMAVLIPFLNFAGVGIPHIGVTFGDMMVELMYVLELTFVGTSDTISPENDYVQAPFHGQSQYFYPSGLQQGSSTQTTEIALYDGNNQTNGITPTNLGDQVSKPVTPSSAPGNPAKGPVKAR